MAGIRRVSEVEGLAPAVGPYSFAAVTDTMVYTAGQVAQQEDGTLVEGGIEEETHQVMRNLGKILGTVGVKFGDVVKANISITDATDFPEVNRVYASYFPEGEYPARETVVVADLLLGATVEISFVAARPDAA